MAIFTVEPAALKDKAAKLNQHAQDFDSICAKLRQAATTMGTAYESADNKQFVTQMEQCCNDLKQMSDKLRTTAQVLTAQSNEYMNREANNTNAARKLPH